MNPIDSTDGRILLFAIDEGRPDSESIVRVLNELAVDFGRNPEVRQFTELALPATMRDNDIPAQIRSATTFVRQHVTFVADPEGTEYVKSPLRMFTDIFSLGRALGDCDDHCLLLASMLRSLGIPAWIVGVKQGPASTYFDHVIVEVDLAGRLLTIDPSCKNGVPPDYNERLIYRL